MDGLQLLAAMKNTPQWRDIPVVMITTEGGETKVGEALKLGAAGYVRKPFTADQIKEKLAGKMCIRDSVAVAPPPGPGVACSASKTEIAAVFRNYYHRDV